MTPRQQADIESIRYFIPTSMKDMDITDDAITQFLALSERGEGRNDGKFARGSGFDALVQGKRWREWHMRAWEETVLDCTIPYIDLVKGLPRVVVDYMKKSMFGGRDALIIEKLWSST